MTIVLFGIGYVISLFGLVTGYYLNENLSE